MLYCAGSLSVCDWDGLKRHYETVGKGEGRTFYCTHVIKCTRANLNILNLIAGRVPYNICRNLEWQVCASQGQVPGQGGRRIRFSFAPQDMNPDLIRGHNLGKCGGWHPAKVPTGGVFGYTNDDIFFLEVCLFNEMCSNTDALFNVRSGEDFVCEFSTAGFAQLQALLLSPSGPMPPSARRCSASRGRTLSQLPIDGRNSSARASK